jgi:hypothetical protein
MNKALLLCLVVALLGLTNAADTCAEHPMKERLEKFIKMAGDYKEKSTDHDDIIKELDNFKDNNAPAADATMT